MKIFYKKKNGKKYIYLSIIELDFFNTKYSRT